MAERRVIFFHNQSDDATIDAMRGAPRYEPKVVLSHTLIREIRIVLGIAHPRDPTLLLLWPKYRKRSRSARLVTRALLATASFAALFFAAAVVAHG
jgi:hypothetical protein